MDVHDALVRGLVRILVVEGLACTGCPEIGKEHCFNSFVYVCRLESGGGGTRTRCPVVDEKPGPEIDVHAAVIAGAVGLDLTDGLSCADCPYLEERYEEPYVMYDCLVAELPVKALLRELFGGRGSPACEAGRRYARDLSERDIAGWRVLDG